MIAPLGGSLMLSAHGDTLEAYFAFLAQVLLPPGRFPRKGVKK
jgi:hypothetical protein